jgi:hypothetical protein
MFATSCLANKLSVLHSATLPFILVLDDHFGNTTDGPFPWSPAAEEARHASEEQYRLLFDATSP